jgi:uncharacterized protein (TIGR04255 family)
MLIHSKFMRIYSLTDSIALTYLYPPVTEAVIEVKVSHEITIEDIEKVASQLCKSYPQKVIFNDLGIHITPQPSGGENVAVNSKPNRYQLSSDDQIDKVIVSQNALAIARLAPYLGWDALHKQFITAWKSWKKVAKTKPIARIGVRYINRIDIPLKDEKKIELEDYLNFYPKVPELSSLPMVEYLVQVTQPINNLWSATITSTVLPSPLINNISLLLDIDLFRTEIIPLKDEDLWLAINDAREIKNSVFESCITRKTKEFFN